MLSGFGGFGGFDFRNDLPSNPNPLSMHYKHVLPEDAASKLGFVRCATLPCTCSYIREWEGGVRRVKCFSCESLEKKPHYKWSWKLNKAVRV